MVNIGFLGSRIIDILPLMELKTLMEKFGVLPRFYGHIQK